MSRVAPSSFGRLPIVSLIEVTAIADEGVEDASSVVIGDLSLEEIPPIEAKVLIVSTFVRPSSLLAPTIRRCFVAHRRSDTVPTNAKSAALTNAVSDV